MRWLALLVLGLAAAGCARTELSGTVDLSGPAQVPSAAAPSDQPRLRAIRLATGAQGTLVRTGGNGTVESWQAPDGSGLALRSGLVVRTFGLGYDLASADVDEVLEALRRPGSSTVARVHRYLDAENTLTPAVWTCRVQGGAARSEPRRGRVRDATEICEGATGTFTNRYLWSLDDMAAIRSTQWVGHEAGYLQIDTRPGNAFVALPIPSGADIN